MIVVFVFVVVAFAVSVCWLVVIAAGAHLIVIVACLVFVSGSAVLVCSWAAPVGVVPSPVDSAKLERSVCLLFEAFVAAVCPLVVCAASVVCVVSLVVSGVFFVVVSSLVVVSEEFFVFSLNVRFAKFSETRHTKAI